MHASPLEELKALDPDAYEPSTAALRQIDNVVMIMAVGPQGAGKTTVMNEAIRRSEIELVVGDTSRAPRPGERQGIDNHYRKLEDMLAGVRARQYLQIAKTPDSTVLYGTRPGQYPQNGIGTKEVYSHAVKKFRTLPFKAIYAAFIVRESLEGWLEGFKTNTRMMPSEVRQARWKEAIRSHEFAFSDNQMRFVLNDTIEAAAKRFIQVADGQKPDDEDIAKTIAHDNYAGLVKILNKSSI